MGGFAHLGLSLRIDRSGQALLAALDVHFDLVLEPDYDAKLVVVVIAEGGDIFDCPNVILCQIRDLLRVISLILQSDHLDKFFGSELLFVSRTASTWSGTRARLLIMTGS